MPFNFAGRTLVARAFQYGDSGFAGSGVNLRTMLREQAQTNKYFIQLNHTVSFSNNQFAYTVLFQGEMLKIGVSIRERRGEK